MQRNLLSAMRIAHLFGQFYLEFVLTGFYINRNRSFKQNVYLFRIRGKKESHMHRNVGEKFKLKKKLYVNKKKYTLYRSKNNIIINCPYLFLSICVEFTYLFHFDFNFFLFSFRILNHSKLRWFFFHMQF